VHVDHVDPALVDRFEGARRRWLDTIDGLPDGRPLFWAGTDGDALVYFTFYPYEQWSDLDARRAAIDRTERRVGEAAVDDYDSGDAALVPPHLSQLWRRLRDLDVGDPTVDERTASRAWVEFRRTPTSWDELETAWADVKSSGHVCRAYLSQYGTGQIVLVWLDPASEDPLGDLGGRIDALVPIERSVRLERREDLSNL
jgi:hypothetical protein